MKVQTVRQQAARRIAMDMVSFGLVGTILAAIAIASGDLRVSPAALGRLVAVLSHPAGE